MSFQFFAWLSSISSGISILSTKITSKHLIKNPWHFNFLMMASISVVTICVSIYSGARFPAFLVPVVLAGITSGLISVAFVFAIYHLDISVLAPLFSFRTFFGLIFGTVLLHEVISRQDIFFILIIFVAGFFVTFDQKLKLRSFFQKGILYALCMTAGLGIFGVFVQIAIRENGFWTASCGISIVALITILPTVLLAKEPLRITRMSLYAIAVITLFDTISRLASQKAYAENYTISQAIVSLPISMFFVFILSQIKPQFLESHPLSVYLVRFIAGGSMIYAAIQLSL